MSELLTLTLWPEWAWAICCVGKRVENRSPAFATQIARRVGDGWLAIHAGKHIGGRPGRPATTDGLGYVAATAAMVGWHIPADDYWAGRYRLLRGDASLLLAPDKITTSAIVAVARVRGVLPPGLIHPWKVRHRAAVALGDVVVLPEPVPAAGAQGLWKAGPEIAAAVMRQVEVTP